MPNGNRVKKESNSLSGEERSRPALRRLHLRHAYGLATVNFIAIIQLISTPHITLDLQWLLAPHSISHLPRVLGFAGMMAMIASVPLLVAFAICFEVITQEEPDFPNHELDYLDDTVEMAFIAVVWLGILGLGATLCAFNLVFVAVFLGAVAFGAREIDRVFRRLRHLRDQKDTDTAANNLK